MAKINILDSSVYNLIAAGEVVERPASVVKELVENCIDAGASIIKVEILGGGINQIKVTDNGCGIEQEYLKTAFLPHATSKIAAAGDLDSIKTLGFRGEALASIAAVSNIKLISKVATSDSGNQITLSAGKVISTSAIGAPDGTSITVSDLFFNVPARAKFLKKAKSEEADITNIMQRFVLANPSLNISYWADGKQILSSNGNCLKDAVYSVYGKEAVQESIEVSGSREGVSLTGYIGRPSYAKGNRTYQTIVLNGRYILNTTISTAVTNAYGEMLMKRKYPFFVLNMQIDPTLVDVNVHPNKLEVRFENPNKIFSLVYEATSRALSEMDYILQVDTSTGEVLKQQSGVNITPMHFANDALQAAPSAQTAAVAPIKFKQIDKAGVDLDFSNSRSAYSSFDEFAKNVTTQQAAREAALVNLAVKMDSVEPQVADNFGLGSKLLEKLAKQQKSSKSSQVHLQTADYVNAAIKTIGKLFNTYLIVEYGSNMYLIDQHAAHERVLYEKFTKQVNNNQIAVQPLMFPFILQTNPIEFNTLTQCLPQINALGFDMVEFGDTSFKISSVPLILSNIDLSVFFEEFLADNKGLVNLKQADVIKEKLMQHSCKSAIKGGNDLSTSEIENLFAQMNNEKIPLFCPHGRPIAVRITKQEIEKWFKRIV